MGDIVGNEEIARILGVSKQRISQYVQAGMPKLGYGKYDPDICKQWLEDNRAHPVPNTQSLADERARYYRAQADRAEYTLEVDRKTYVHFETLVAALANVVHELNSALDTYVDSAPTADEQELRRECAWLARSVLERAIESVCDDTPGISGAQAAGLQNRRSVR